MAMAGQPSISRDAIRRYRYSLSSFAMVSWHNLTAVCRKLVIIGDGACGKTSLLSVFTLGEFPRVRTFAIGNVNCRIMYVSLYEGVKLTIATDYL